MRALLLSGGLDSTALAYWLKPELAVTVDYGQSPAAGEIRASAKVCETLAIRHEVISADLSQLGAGLLVGEAGARDDMPMEWWPYRNQMLVTLAAMRLAKRGVDEIIIGTVRDDARHCDGRPEFVQALDLLLSLQKPGTRLSAPAMSLAPEELLARSRVPTSLLGWTISCHVDPLGCGECPGCQRHFARLAAYTQPSQATLI